MSFHLKRKLSLIRSQIMTILGNPRGFFVPYEYVKTVTPVSEPYAEVEELFFHCDVAGFIDEMVADLSRFRSFGQEVTDPEWGAGMFPPLDGMSTYTAVRMFKPQRIIEIGCGDSTRFLARAIADNGSGRITCIDPAPRRWIGDLGVELVTRVLTNEDADLCASLERDDMVFIDSSHIMLQGMDVDIQFNRVFPKLKSGVIVHLHDIKLPDGYPSHWADWHWSEQNALIGWLLSGYFEVIYPGHYAVTRQAAHIDRVLGPFLQDKRKVSGSLWLRKA
jgi:Methyltransferase domain